MVRLWWRETISAPRAARPFLELVRRQALALTQKDAFGDIGLKRHRGFDEVLAQDESLTAIEQEYT